MNYKIINGDSLVELKTLAENTIDSIVTDPPYGLSFMGKKWDYQVPSVELWQEILRVLKPGGHLLSFSGSRTYHRMAVNIEDAGFEIRDQIQWVYGSGFSKSHNIGKAVDKLQGNEREKTGEIKKHAQKGVAIAEERGAVGAGAFGQAKEEEVTKGTSPFEGWGTALKPAHEPIVVARKPLSEKTVALNVLKWGTAGINIDGCRVEVTSDSSGWSKTGSKESENNSMSGKNYNRQPQIDNPQGRFPANFIHDGSDEVVGLFPDSKSTKTPVNKGKSESVFLANQWKRGESHSDSGSASRFFYCAKTSKKDRNEGLEQVECKQYSHDGRNKEIENAFQRNKSVSANNHPTVKPTKLMQYLVRLVTPKGGTLLDPFMGSGSTGKACVLESFNFIGIELDQEYCKIAEARIKHLIANKKPSEEGVANSI